MNVSELLLGGSVWWVLPCSLLTIGATFGLVPGLLLRLIVQLYPKGHPRREELFGELYDPEMGRVERFEWVFQQLETAFRQGPAMRNRARAERRRKPLIGEGKPYARVPVTKRRLERERRLIEEARRAEEQVAVAELRSTSSFSMFVGSTLDSDDLPRFKAMNRKHLSEPVVITVGRSALFPGSSAHGLDEINERRPDA